MRRLRLTGQNSDFSSPFVGWCGQPEQITGIANVYMSTIHPSAPCRAHLQWVDCPCELADDCSTLKAEREKGGDRP